LPIQIKTRPSPKPRTKKFGTSNCDVYVMPKPKLPFLHCHTSRHGRRTYYVKLTKREKGRGVRITDPVFRSEGFMAQYHAAVRGTPIMPTPLIGKDGKGTVGWLINLYKKSRAWCEDISQETRK